MTPPPRDFPLGKYEFRPDLPDLPDLPKLAAVRSVRPLTAQEIVDRMRAVEGTLAAWGETLEAAFNGNAAVVEDCKANIIRLERRLRECEARVGLRPPD